MSIIYDALKKIQDSQIINSSVKINKTGKSKPKIYLAYVLAVCLGLFIAGIFLNLYRKQFKFNNFKKIQDATLSQALPKDLVQPSESNAPNLETDTSGADELKKVTPHSLVLNGVFFSQNQGYALINNQIVKEGDTIDGALVLRITLEEVELESGGSTIKLYASR